MILYKRIESYIYPPVPARSPPQYMRRKGKDLYTKQTPIPVTAHSFFFFFFFFFFIK